MTDKTKTFAEAVPDVGKTAEFSAKVTAAFKAMVGKVVAASGLRVEVKLSTLEGEVTILRDADGRIVGRVWLDGEVTVVGDVDGAIVGRVWLEDEDDNITVRGELVDKPAAPK